MNKELAKPAVTIGFGLATSGIEEVRTAERSASLALGEWRGGVSFLQDDPKIPASGSAGRGPGERRWGVRRSGYGVAE